MIELKCGCEGTAKRASNIKCKEEMVDPYQANLYLKYVKLREMES